MKSRWPTHQLVGNFRNRGQEWQPQGEPQKTLVHDFPDKELGKAIPYGIYDLGRNEGWVSLGIDHDTAEFAIDSILAWWKYMGSKAYPKATKLLIMADSGGSNASRSRLWKIGLQHLANLTGLHIQMSHFPPGTSKVAVGIAIARAPLPRSGRAQLAHPAPTSGESAY